MTQGYPNLDLLCFGEPMVELMAQNQTPPLRFQQNFGGDTANTAVAAARQGAMVGYICALGDDLFGQAFIDLWHQEAIDTQAVVRNPQANTGIYLVQPHGEQRNFTYYRQHSAASQFSAADLPLDYIKQARHMHVSAISQAISQSMQEATLAALKYAQSQGLGTSYDTNLRLTLWASKEQAWQCMQTAMAYTDTLFPSLDEITLLTGISDKDAIIDLCLALGPSLVVLKCGAQGAYLGTPTQRLSIPAVETKAVDSTGAGDAFAGAFLAAQLAGASLAECGQRAAKVASNTVSGYGALA